MHRTAERVIFLKKNVDFFFLVGHLLELHCAYIYVCMYMHCRVGPRIVTAGFGSSVFWSAYAYGKRMLRVE